MSVLGAEEMHGRAWCGYKDVEKMVLIASKHCDKGERES